MKSPHVTEQPLCRLLCAGWSWRWCFLRLHQLHQEDQQESPGQLLIGYCDDDAVSLLSIVLCLWGAGYHNVALFCRFLMCNLRVVFCFPGSGWRWWWRWCSDLQHRESSLFLCCCCSLCWSQQPLRQRQQTQKIRQHSVVSNSIITYFTLIINTAKCFFY